MVNEQGHLEENDISQTQEDDQSQADLSTSGGRRGFLRRAFGIGDTSSDEDDRGLYIDRGLEQHSSLKHSGHPRVS